MNRFLGRLDVARGQFAAANATLRDGCHAVSRGYVANAEELRAEARRRGDDAQGGNDVLFALAYRWWGEALQEHVVGEYAVAIYDERERRLLLTHDALGLVTCFYAVLGGAVVVGSHLDDVVRAAGAGGDDDIDPEYVADHLALGRPSTGHTPYRAVRRLLAGRTLTFANGAASERTTWDLANVPKLRLASDAEYEERCRELIAEGVRAALDAGGTVWSELSGGLDSSTVTCAAAALCGRPVPAVSFVYGRSATGDERPWMRSVVKRYALPWHQIDVDDTPPFADLPPPVFAEPNATMPLSLLNRRYIDLLEGNGVDAVLSGAGGDNVFAGDSPEPRHLGDALRRFDPAGFARGLHDWKRRSPARRSLLHWLSGNVVRPALRHARGCSVLVDGSPSFTVPSWVDARFARDMHLDERIGRRYAPRCRFVGDQYFAESLHIFGTVAGVHRDLLAERFEYRRPLLYRPLVEFMFAVPWEQRLEPDCERSLQRRALVGVLPEKVRRRRNKTGTQQAYLEGLRRNGDWLDMLRKRPQIVERGYVDARAWSEAVEQARFGRMHTMSHFISAITLECWLRHRDQTNTYAAGTGSQGVIDERPEILFRA